MLQQIALGAALVAATIIVQACLMVAGLHALQRLDTSKRDFTHHHATFLIMIFVLFMFLGIIVDVWIWAVVYIALGAIPSLEQALYFSTTSFTTLGYGDVVLTQQWRLLGAFEGANGLIIFGWTTALVIAAIQRFYSWTEK